MDAVASRFLPVPYVVPMNRALEHVLAVCGLNAQQRNAIRIDGVKHISDLFTFTKEDVSEMAKRINDMKPHEGGAHIGQPHIINLRALTWWVQDLERRSQSIDVNEFTPETLKSSILQMQLELAEADSKKELQPLSKFDPKQWVAWEEEAKTYLASIKGVRNIPLVYIIRKDLPDGHTFVNEMERLIYQAPLTGPVFKADARQVHNILRAAVIGTDGWHWFKDTDLRQDGRVSMDKLRAHYDGEGAVSHRLTRARQRLASLYYKNENALSFEKYSTSMNDCFLTMAEAKQPKTENEKVEILLQGMKQCDNVKVQSSVVYISMDNVLRNSFTAAVNKISEQIAQIYPALQPRETRKVSDVNAFQGRGPGRGRGRGRGGRGPGRGGAGRGQQQLVNGVDISNFTRNYSAEEWAKIPQLHAAIQSARDKNKSRNIRKIDEINTQQQQQDQQQQQPCEQDESSSTATGAGTAFGRLSQKKRKH